MSEDRDAILARRAIFVASAIAAFGCSSKPTEQARLPAPRASASAPALTIGPRPGPAKPWREFYKDAPELAMPDGVHPVLKRSVSELYDRIDEIYGMLAGLEQSLPSFCPLPLRACENEWRQFSADLAMADSRIDAMRDRCGPGNDSPYNRMRHLHHEWHLKKLEELKETANLVARGWSDGAAIDFNALYTAARATRPSVCLNCVSGPPVIAETVFFGARVKEVRPPSFQILDAVLYRLAESPTMTLEIEGHADAGEGSTKACMQLGLQRAEAVKKYFVEHDIDAARLTVISAGSARPRGPDSSAKSPESNRVVEFHIRTP